MPEGDTIAWHASRIRPVLEGHVPDAVITPHPRFERDRWPDRLAGQAVRAVDTHGKHLFLRFEGGLTIHSHLRMTGTWNVLRKGRQWPRSPRAAWLVLRRGEQEVVQFHGPVLELMTDSRTRFDRRLNALGPDILADELDEAGILRRLRHDDPTRPIGDALLQQSIVAGIGNLWKCEGCLLGRVDPWRPAGEVSDEEVLGILRQVRPRMQESARTGHQFKFKTIYGQPLCPVCQGPVERRGQWDDNRVTYWCPRCQR
jgi:endonuclease-8